MIAVSGRLILKTELYIFRLFEGISGRQPVFIAECESQESSHASKTEMKVLGIGDADCPIGEEVGLVDTV